MIINQKYIDNLYPNMKLYGPYNSRKDSRTYYVLKEINLNGKTSKKSKSKSILKSRLMKEIEQNTVLNSNTHIHHKDENMFNDTLLNLESVESSDHASYHFNKIRVITRQELICHNCGQKFLCSQIRIKTALSKQKLPCCSRACSAKLYWNNQYTGR